MNTACPILIVDDDASILELVALVLAEMDYPVDTASGGAEALQRLENTSPAIILLDMRMPHVSGWDVAQHIQESGHDRPRVVAMTAARDARAWASEIGAAGFLAKPFDLTDLVEVVEQACADLG